MAQRLNWGILGTGDINRVLIPPLRNSTRNTLIGVASRNLDRANAYAEHWLIPRAYGSYADLLADPDISVIYNSLPNTLHAEWTIKAAQAGKHVLCEKPIALTLSELDAIENAGQKNGVVIQEAFMYRHHPQTLKVQDLIKAGILGEVWLIRGSFSFLLKNLNNIRFNKDLGGGSLWDLGCYPISYSRMVVGSEPAEVEGYWNLAPTGVDTSFVGQMRFDSGVVVQFDSSFNAPPRNYMEIVGEEGSIMVPNPFVPRGEEKIILNKQGCQEVIQLPYSDLWSGEVENIASAIMDGIAPRVSLNDSRGNAITILALLASAQSQKTCKINMTNYPPEFTMK